MLPGGSLLPAHSRHKCTVVTKNSHQKQQGRLCEDKAECSSSHGEGQPLKLPSCLEGGSSSTARAGRQACRAGVETGAHRCISVLLLRN